MKAFYERIQNLNQNGINLHSFGKENKRHWNKEAPKNKRSVTIRDVCSVTFFFFFFLFLRKQPQNADAECRCVNQKVALSCNSNLDKEAEAMRELQGFIRGKVKLKTN